MTDIHIMDRHRFTPTELPLTCTRCERLAVVYDAEERPLCARHATIFMTAERLDRRQSNELSATRT